MGYTNLAQRKPMGASCGWTQQEIASGAPYKWWRPKSGQNCTLRTLDISLVIPIPCNGVFLELTGFTYGGAASPSYWIANGGSSYSVTLCNSTLGTYVTYHSGGGAVRSDFEIDVWKMYYDGLWTSSIAIPLTLWSYSTESTTLSVGAYPNVASGVNLGIPNTTSAISTSATLCLVCACIPAATTTKTVTVYDDGTITIT